MRLTFCLGATLVGAAATLLALAKGNQENRKVTLKVARSNSLSERQIRALLLRGETTVFGRGREYYAWPQPRAV